MKKLLDGLYVVMGTLCLFGLPSAALGFSAWFGDGVMAMLHTSTSAMHSIGFQIEAVIIVFGTSAGALALALLLFAGLWLAARAVNRAAEGFEVLPVPAAGRLRVASEERTVGRIDHSGSHRRGRQQIG
jgi:hypothetical protein